MKAFRSLYAKNYGESEWLGDIYDYKAEDAHYMKAAISPSQPGIGRCDYNVWVAVLDSSVLTGNCSCPAGAGKTCSHIAALLYAVILSWEHGVAGETCTDKLQVWGRGATRVLASNDTFSEILDGTVNKKVKCDDKFCKPNQFLDHHELQTFVSQSKMKPLWNCKGTMLHKILSAPAKAFEEKVPLVHGCHDADWNMPVTEIPCASCQHFLDKFVKISKASAECLERQTKQQSSLLWMESRKIRLTASKVSSLPKTKRANPDKYVTNHIYNRFKGSAATHHGLRCEPLACEWFEGETGLTVCKSGLQIHGDEQYIAASPDGILSENSILEIKCPTKTIAELIHSDKYDIQKSPNGELFLSPKGKNGYYSQVQMTMFCTKSSICKFVVWTAEEQLILDIPYDENYVSNELPKIRKFYFQHLLPRLTDENHFGRLQLSREYKKLC